MRAFTIDKYKERGGGRLAEAADPEPGDGDVLIRVHSASVNPLDLKIRSGGLKTVLPYRFPLILGNDLAGTVVRTGPSVTGFSAGDEVYAKPDQSRIGTFANLIAVAEADVAPKPAGLTMDEAAALPLVALTSWQALVDRAGVTAGTKVLVQGGAGGVGSIAVQLAKELGAHVAATASTAKVDLVRGLGADEVIDYRTQDVSELLDGYDVVLDTVGGATLENSVHVLRPGGRIISIAGPPDRAFARQMGANPVIQLVMSGLSAKINRLARKHGVTYEFLFMTADGEQLREITSLVEAGAIRPLVDRVFPFEETGRALEYVEQGRAKAGKVVVAVAPAPSS
ncbi:NADP-dependent oxidoreductase [Streptomyces fractus]|uniref:NADP-dependent oxidoreductase n=1 Tax=Streptomyces fractus TaxID=641806 RepID=UPI003CEB8722